MILAGNWQFFCCGRKFSLRPEKKSSSRLSGGCVSFWFWREIGSFFDVAGNFHYDQKKKSSSRLSGGYAINYDRKKKRYGREIFITTGKKKRQLAPPSKRILKFFLGIQIPPIFCISQLRDQLRPEKKKIQAGNFHYERKKKMFQSSVWRVRDQLRPEKKKIQAGNFHYERKKKKFQSSVWRVPQKES